MIPVPDLLFGSILEAGITAQSFYICLGAALVLGVLVASVYARPCGGPARPVFERFLCLCHTFSLLFVENAVELMCKCFHGAMR